MARSSQGFFCLLSSAWFVFRRTRCGRFSQLFCVFLSIGRDEVLTFFVSPLDMVDRGSVESSLYLLHMMNTCDKIVSFVNHVTFMHSCSLTIRVSFLNCLARKAYINSLSQSKNDQRKENRGNQLN